mgnify:CR=1 FL=1
MRTLLNVVQVQKIGFTANFRSRRRGAVRLETRFERSQCKYGRLSHFGCAWVCARGHRGPSSLEAEWPQPSASACVLLSPGGPSSLDAESRTKVLELIREQARGGSAVLIASHDEGVLPSADRILKIQSGRIQEAS